MQRGKLGFAIASAAAVAFIGASASGQVVWSDDMEAYAPGSGILGQGGWTAWGDDPAWDSFVTDANANSGTNSLDVLGDSDSVYRFDVNHGDIVSGQWTVSTQLFVPSGLTGQTYFILLNSYDGVSDLNWSVQVIIDADAGSFVDTGPDGATLPLIFDTWIEVRVDIDLDNDTQSFYVGGDLLYTGSWTEWVSGGGDLELEAMDLFANGASSVYYDDFQLEQAQSACLDLVVSPLVGGEMAQFDVAGGEPGHRGAVVWGLGGNPSSFIDVNGWCATFGFDVKLSGNTINIVGSSIFDDNGQMTVNRMMPGNHPGLDVLFQAAERETCPGECMSDVVLGTIG